MTQEDIKQLADNITANMQICSKTVLTADEAARFLGISKSCLYKMTMKMEIPFYKPHGKVCYFNRLELETWMQNNRVEAK
jgi:excisionase family DNA binding protein